MGVLLQRLFPSIALTLSLCALATPRAAGAATRRPRFEPTDLETADPGAIEVDVEAGAIRSQSETSIAAPDVEIDVGVTDNVELDIDGALTISGLDGPAPSPALGADALWTGLKVGLMGDSDTRTGSHWGLGFQVGPRIALVTHSQEVGAEGLILFARGGRRWGLATNLGAYAEPRLSGATQVDRGVLFGLDGHYQIRPALSAEFELFAVLTSGVAQHQLGTSAMLAWQCSPAVSLSARALGGWLGAGLAYGLLFGVSFTVQAWSGQ
ncbi:MAG: hypothetical protein WCJ30_02175 [Deltaproteobacteria bacterium]